MKNSGKKTGPEFLLARVMQPFEEDRLHGHNTKSTLPSKVLKNLPIPPAVKASAKFHPGTPRLKAFATGWRGCAPIGNKALTTGA